MDSIGAPDERHTVPIWVPFWYSIILGQYRFGAREQYYTKLSLKRIPSPYENSLTNFSGIRNFVYELMKIRIEMAIRIRNFVYEIRLRALETKFRMTNWFGDEIPYDELAPETKFRIRI